jgi:hypothetical protein
MTAMRAEADPSSSGGGPTAVTLNPAPRRHNHGARGNRRRAWEGGEASRRAAAGGSVGDPSIHTVRPNASRLVSSGLEGNEDVESYLETMSLFFSSFFNNYTATSAKKNK